MQTVNSEATQCQGHVLPETELRTQCDVVGDDALFVRTAHAEADRLIKAFYVGEQSAVLDIGCGPGRLATGLIEYIGEIAKYRGVDVNERSIEWCQQNITPNNPSYCFTHLDVKNDRYNASGGQLDTSFRLPFNDGEFDVAYLLSVFSHMRPRPVSIYLREIQRVLKPKGYAFITAFVEENVPPVEENPKGYGKGEWSGPLNCVRYEKEYFMSMISASGLRTVCFDYAAEESGQSGLYLMKPNETEL